MAENTEVFSSTYDSNGSSYSFNDLDQLSSNSNVLDVSKDPNSSLEKVVLSDGPFQFNTHSYINDSIRDYLIKHTETLHNQQFPVTVSSSGQFNINVDLKNEYLLFPSSVNLTVVLQLYVRKSDGKKRAITAVDCLCPLDGLNPIKNVKPCFDNHCTISNNKVIDQRGFARIMQILMGDAFKGRQLSNFFLFS